MSTEKDVLKGVCYLCSETGTEGGYWAFQDARFITKDVLRPYCAKCGKYLESPQNETLEVTKVLPLAQVLGGEEPTECPDGQHERLMGDSWSYDGSHILRDGDRLTIFSPNDPTLVVWSGVIALRQHPLYTEHASGYWIHADQEGIDRDVWAGYFFENYPAELQLTRKP